MTRHSWAGEALEGFLEPLNFLYVPCIRWGSVEVRLRVCVAGEEEPHSINK